MAAAVSRILLEEKQGNANGSGDRFDRPKNPWRRWRKLHLAVNPDGMQVVASKLTEANVHDDSVMPDLLRDQSVSGKVYADGAYLSKSCFDSIAATGGQASIAMTALGMPESYPVA